MRTLAAVSFLAGALFADVASAQDESPPNVLWIIGDDQAWSDYGFMGHPHIQTPHLDRLAEQSLTLRRAYVPTSLCCPSLATMITGLYPHQHAITGNEPCRTRGLEKSELERRRTHMDDKIEAVATLPRMLAKQGYRSLQTGKWWHGSYERGGFTAGMTHGDPKRGGRHGDVGLKIGREGLKPITDFLDADDDRPWFMWYAPFLPHTPHNPPKRLLDKYRDKAPTLPIAKYWAMCEWFDETCGQLLAELDARGLTDNTIVMFCCDNGWINRPNASRYAPRSKRSPYEGGTRNPIMVRWPGKVAPLDSPDLATTLDLVPTTLAMLGVKVPGGMPGLNLLDVEARQGRKQVVGEIFFHDAKDVDVPSANLRYRWIVRGRHKLILPWAAGEPDAKLELFDVVADPYEKQDLAGENAELVKELTAELDRVWGPGR